MNEIHVSLLEAYCVYQLSTWENLLWNIAQHGKGLTWINVHGGMC